MKEQHFIWSSSLPHHFHNIEVLPGACNHSLKTMASSLGPIFFVCMHACALKDHLTTTWDYYSRSLN